MSYAFLRHCQLCRPQNNVRTWNLVVLYGSPSETLQMIEGTHVKAAAKKTQVYEWHKCFRDGHETAGFFCTSVVFGHKVLCQAQCVGSVASAMFPGLHTARLFRFPFLPVLERRISHRKSYESTDRDIGNGFQECVQKVYEHCPRGQLGRKCCVNTCRCKVM